MLSMAIINKYSAFESINLPPKVLLTNIAEIPTYRRPIWWKHQLEPMLKRLLQAFDKFHPISQNRFDSNIHAIQITTGNWCLNIQRYLPHSSVAFRSHSVRHFDAIHRANDSMRYSHSVHLTFWHSMLCYVSIIFLNWLFVNHIEHSLHISLLLNQFISNIHLRVVRGRRTEGVWATNNFVSFNLVVIRMTHTFHFQNFQQCGKCETIIQMDVKRC